jgi:hypothetical protein
MIDAPSSIDDTQLRSYTLRYDNLVGQYILVENVEHQLFYKKQTDTVIHYDSKYYICFIINYYYYYNALQVQLNFSMNLKVTDSYRRRNRKDILFMLQESTRKNYAKGDRVSYEEEEGRKRKSCCESSSYLSKKYFLLHYRCINVRLFRDVFFGLLMKILVNKLKLKICL